MSINKYLPVLAGITFASIFGFSFLFTKEGLELVAPLQLLAYRFKIAALALTLLWLLGIIKINIRREKIGMLFLLGLFQPVLYFLFETTGINLTSASEAGLMVSLIPIVVAILAAIFLKERPSSLQVFFILLSVSGVILIIAMQEALALDRNLLGFLFLGGAVLMAGVYNILSRLLSISYRPIDLTFFMMWIGALIFNTMALFQLDWQLGIYLEMLRKPPVYISVLYLGLFSSVVAFLMMNYTLSRIRAYQSAVFANLTTVIAILAGVFIRNEPFYWFQVLGGAMIILGVWGTNYFGQLEAPAAQSIAEEG